MEEYITQYKRLLKEKEDILKTLKELENIDVVKKYKELFDRSIELNYKENVVYEMMIIDKICKCEHIFIPNNSYYHCIKCGLDTSLQDIKNVKNKDDKIIYNYLSNYSIKGTFIDDVEDVQLIICIYNEFKKRYEKLDESTLDMCIKEFINKQKMLIKKINPLIKD